MKLCSACSKTLPKESFSKRQWLLNQQQRKCKECVDANQVVHLKAPPKIDSTEKHAEKQLPSCSADDEGASCWICLEAGPDDDGQPLRRDCSCRGTDAGFAHLSCIVEYATNKQTQKHDGRVDLNKLDQLAESWSYCSGCHQPYQNELALDLATDCVTFVERKYPDDRSIQLNAHWRKLRALVGLLPTQKEIAKQVASNMISMIGHMIIETPSLAQDVRICKFELIAYGHLGIIAAEEGTKESVVAAIWYFEKQRDISKAIGYHHGLGSAEKNLSYAMSKCEGGADISVDEKLRQNQKFYKLSVKQFGQVDAATIGAGTILAYALNNADHCVEAERLLTKLASTSKRVHGPDHQLTQMVESDLQECKVRVVWINFEGEVTRFQALQYTEDGKKCIVQGPIVTPRNIQNEKIFKVSTKYIRFTIGTPVVCHGLHHTPHLNGKIGDLRLCDEYGVDSGKYEVHFEDKELEPCKVELPDNIRILFDLPDEP